MLALKPHLDVRHLLWTVWVQLLWSHTVLPAADMALEDINSNPSILPGYNLVYDKVRDSQVCLLILNKIRHEMIDYSLSKETTIQHKIGG